MLNFNSILSRKHIYIESEEVSFKVNFYDFSFDYVAFRKTKTLNNHRDLMVQNNVKEFLDLLKIVYWVIKL